MKLPLALMAAFLALAGAVALGWTMPLDQAITVDIAGHRTGFLNDVAVNVNALGSAPVVTLIALLAATYVVAAGRPGLVLAFLWPPLSFLVTIALKPLFHHPRPTEALIATPDSSSFPSGHALAASALYITLAIIASATERRARPKRLLLAGGVVVALLVAWSGVYLGLHYFTDVVGGFLLGTAGALVAARAIRVTPITSSESDRQSPRGEVV